MSKHLTVPTSRLICFGSAKASTNAVLTDNNREDDKIHGFED
jgi:hypothetical protein